MQHSREEVLALLTALGSTEEEVANTLISLGIRGNKRECSSCPISQYLISKGVVRGWVAVGVGQGVGVGWHWYPTCNYPQLQSVQDFIISFDKGKFPQCELSDNG
jgi:hypothetical protein